MLKVGDILEGKGHEVWSMAPEATAYEALQIMAEKDIGAVLVIQNGRLAGIFSERDYARKVILKGKSSRETTVGELMTERVYSITPDRPVEECMVLMTATMSRHVPVFEHDQLIGIVSLGDVVNAVIAEQKVLIHDLENYIICTDFIHTTQ